MKIAYIDNDDDIRELVCLALTTIGGFKAHTFSSAESALQYVPIYRPDFVLLEARLPGISGIEVCERLSATPALGGTTFAFLTTQVSPKDIVKLGAFAPVIPKPFDPLMLSSQVMSLHGERAHKAAA